MNKSKFSQELKDKAYRDAFVAAQIRVGIPFQIRALRKQRHWDQKTLAKEAGMLQPRISALESPGNSALNLGTLKRLASAFDVALIVRFAPFNDLVKFSDEFSPDDFQVASFDGDMIQVAPTIDNIYSIVTGAKIHNAAGSYSPVVTNVSMSRMPTNVSSSGRAVTSTGAETDTHYERVNENAA